MMDPIVIHTYHDDVTVLFHDMDKATKYIIKYAKQTDIYDEILQDLCNKAVCLNDAVDILDKFDIPEIRVYRINKIDPEV